MSQAIIKLVCVSALSLTPFQALCMEKKEGGQGQQVPRRTERVRFQRVDIDTDLDAIDREQEAKKQRFLNQFDAEVIYYILRAPTKVDKSGKKIKTERIHFKNIGGAGGVYISAMFTDNDQANAIRAALSPAFATYIEEIGDYESPQATHRFMDALANVIQNDSKTEIHPRVTFKFIHALEMGQQDTDTAILIQKQGKKGAQTDTTLYQAMIGDKEVKYLSDENWKRANLTLNISYTSPKKPVQVIEIRKLPLLTSQSPTKMMQDALGRAMEKEDVEIARRKAVMILPEPVLPAASVFRLLMNRSLQLKPTGARSESVYQKFTLKTVDKIGIMLADLYKTLGTSEDEIKTLSDLEINLKFPDLSCRSKGDPEDYDFGQTAALAKQQGPAEEVIQLYEIVYKGQVFTYTPPGQSTANKANFRSSVTTHHAKPAAAKAPTADSSKATTEAGHS